MISLVPLPAEETGQGDRELVIDEKPHADLWRIT
jgi:hypothetical protein